MATWGNKAACRQLVKYIRFYDATVSRNTKSKFIQYDGYYISLRKRSLQSHQNICLSFTWKYLRGILAEILWRCFLFLHRSEAGAEFPQKNCLFPYLRLEKYSHTWRRKGKRKTKLLEWKGIFRTEIKVRAAKQELWDVVQLVVQKMNLSNWSEDPK